MNSHKLINHRRCDLNLLRLVAATNLLRTRLCRAFALYCEASEDTEIAAEKMRALEACYAECAEHWKRVHGDIGATSKLQSTIFIFQNFLQLKLLEDYGNKPYTLKRDLVEFARLIIRQEEMVQNAGHYTQEYVENVMTPLQEMMIDRGHVVNKLRTACERDGRPGNDLRPLFDRGEWAVAASVLKNDHEIFNQLRRGCNVLFNPPVCHKILTGIEKYEKQL